MDEPEETHALLPPADATPSATSSSSHSSPAAAAVEDAPAFDEPDREDAAKPEAAKPSPPAISVSPVEPENPAEEEDAEDEQQPDRYSVDARELLPLAATCFSPSLRSPSSILRSPAAQLLANPRPAVPAAAAGSPFQPSRARETSALLSSFPRTHSFPSDLYSGARYSRFEIEEAMRAKNGQASLLDWLVHGRGGRGWLSGWNKERRQREAERADLAKKAKAQHLESFDYDFFESRVNQEHDYEQTESEIRALNLGRWVMTFGIGLCTALVACFVETMTGFLSGFRTDTMEKVVQLEDGGRYRFGTGFLVYAGISVGFVSIASYCVAILCPVAGGSGISEIKATLNGIKIHRVVRIKTLVCKAFGILFSVSGGLPCGKEGPMIHSGAVIGAGLSQGKSSSFGLDTSWTKFKGFRNDKEKRDFISCGAAAGVAAAFGAPIGGVLFALEEGASFWHQNLTWRTFFCAMVSAFVFNIFVSYKEVGGDNDEPSPDGHIEIGGMMGTQQGTFSFGSFVVSKSYDVLDVPIFILMGMIGGLFGAAFNGANTVLTRFRMRFLMGKWSRFGEALFIAFSMAAASFWLSYYFGECRAVGGPYQDSLSRFYCPEGHYNDLASLFTVSYQTSMKQLLHFTGDASFSPLSLCMFFSVFYVFACWTYGIAVPSGLFVPSLLAGAAYGRLCVLILHTINFPVGAQDGMFALIGAACMLGGMARMTISLTVIILECTGVIEWGLPIMVALMAARWVGNSFNEGLYDIHIHLKHLPFLEYDPPYYARFLRAENIMSHPPTCVPQIAKVGEIYDILRSSNHAGFPVVVPPSDSGSKTAAAKKTTADGDFRQFSLDRRVRNRKKQGPLRYAGLIYRRHLCVLLQRKDFFIEKPAPFTRKPAGETTLLYNDQYALSYRDIESNYPRYPKIQDIKLDDDERDLWMDLTPYMNPTPHTVQDQTPVPRTFRLFRSLGLRHITVLNRRNEVRGVITRKDLTPAHLKFCLEALSETEKMRIQGYFQRDRAGSERFEDVERTLLKIVDNS